MTYDYDARGRGIGEKWVNSADPRDIYILTYRHDETGSRIAGGKGVGTSLGNSRMTMIPGDER